MRRKKLPACCGCLAMMVSCSVTLFVLFMWFAISLTPGGYVLEHPSTQTAPTSEAVDREPKAVHIQGGPPAKTVEVKGHVRRDGVYVSPHVRSAPRSR